MLAGGADAGVSQGFERAQRAVLERLVEVFRSVPMVEMLGQARCARLMEAVETPGAGLARAFLELRQVVNDQALHDGPSPAVLGAMQSMWHLATAQAKWLGSASEGRQLASLSRAVEAVTRAETEVIAEYRVRRHLAAHMRQDARTTN